MTQKSLTDSSTLDRRERVRADGVVLTSMDPLLSFFVFLCMFLNSQRELLRYVYVEGFKGGILKSSHEEEWHYWPKGLVM